MIARLYDSFQPDNYALTLDIDSANLTFSGTVTITGTLAADSAFVQLHAKELEIASASINGTDAIHTYPDEDTLELKLAQPIKAGEIAITAAFSGTITDAMNGMYPCYFDHDGKKKWLIATQFESHHAREVFPCVDEPAAKATFDLTLVTEAGIEILSNMPIKEQRGESRGVSNTLENSDLSPRASGLVTTFETTPKMSTYLLAFVAGEMVSKEATTKDGVLVRNWASIAHDPALLDYSLKEAIGCIEFYNDYFGTPYPLEKCDQVALPDFDAGAMENWGLVTYRETALLADPKNRSISSEQYISLVIAHELSHQWFGNLVTMQWWDDLWLNESFASLMEFIALDHLHPDWQVWEDYTASDAVMASNRDVFSDVQPVRIDVNDPAEISSLFDGAIVYAKGGRLLKMLREYIGEDAFRAGLKQYFKRHAYVNTTRDDLWNVLEESSKKPVSTIMNSWLEQSGLPRLQISQRGAEVKLLQERLVLDEPEATNQLWQIPLLSDPKLPVDLLAEKEAVITAPSSEPVLFNEHASGHYVVDYEDKQQKQALREALKNGEINASGRINALNDLILLARAGEDSLISGLELISACSHEPRDGVWALMGSILGHARVLTEGSSVAEAGLKSFSYKLAKDQHAQLGWEAETDEDVNTTQLRRTVAGLALASEDETVIKEALERFDSALPAELDAQFRSLYMSAAVRFGDASVIDTLIALYRETNSADLQSDICGALTTTKDPAVGEKLLGLLKDKDTIRPQDLVRWYAYLMRNKHTRPLTWQWLKDNWQWLMETFGSSKSYDYFPRYAANFMNSEAWLKEYTDFFTPKLDDPALKRTIKVGIKEIQARNAWRTRDEQQIIDWLKSH